MIDQYHRDGFIIVKLFDIETLKMMRKSVINFLIDRNIEKESPDEKYVDMNRQTLAEMYSSQNDNGALKNKLRLLSQMPCVVGTAGNESLSSLLRALGLKVPVVSSSPEFRTDFPQDEQYMQPWHQDWLYSQTSLNSVTIWTPLHDTTVDEGALLVRRGSQASGVEDFNIHLNPRKFEIKKLSAIGEEQLPMKFGESLLFSQLLHHKSGLNISNKVRLSFQLRYADAGDDEWRNSGYYKADKNITGQRQLTLP